MFQFQFPVESKENMENLGKLFIYFSKYTKMIIIYLFCGFATPKIIIQITVVIVKFSAVHGYTSGSIVDGITRMPGEIIRGGSIGPCPGGLVLHCSESCPQDSTRCQSCNDLSALDFCHLLEGPVFGRVWAGFSEPKKQI